MTFFSCMFTHGYVSQAGLSFWKWLECLQATQPVLYSCGKSDPAIQLSFRKRSLPPVWISVLHCVALGLCTVVCWSCLHTEGVCTSQKNGQMGTFSWVAPFQRPKPMNSPPDKSCPKLKQVGHFSYSWYLSGINKMQAISLNEQSDFLRLPSVKE